MNFWTKFRFLPQCVIWRREGKGDKKNVGGAEFQLGLNLTNTKWKKKTKVGGGGEGMVLSPFSFRFVKPSHILSWLWQPRHRRRWFLQTEKKGNSGLLFFFTKLFRKLKMVMYQKKGVRNSWVRAWGSSKLEQTKFN